MKEFTTCTVAPIWEFETISFALPIARSEEDRERFLEHLRDAKLAEVDALEKMMKKNPTTAQIRQWWKENHR